MNFPIQNLNSGFPVPSSLLADAFGVVPCKGGNHRAGKRYSEGVYTCTYCRLPLVQQVIVDIMELSQAVASITPVQAGTNG